MSRDRLGLLLSPEHRLARLVKIWRRDLASGRVLLQPRQLHPRLHADILTAARTQGVTLHVTAEVLDLEALLALVVIGDAITFLTEKFWEPASQASLPWRPVEDLHTHLSEFVTWRAEDTDAPVGRALIESAREVSPILQGAADRTRSSKTARRKRRSKR
ncbi:LysR substrate-binding domain-containing protein [Pyxidicoccus sp. MSG2]|uniref:LysR substrate-binding domain-containing protein n=1 Tax=Pyxidicoccus sp. MSG2 TaxID=2996790 RepID=UPI00226E88D3|nr:LysR substrate-binding domain-containing protein [Pyxidicoccus sp. MSG2]MCY1021132.1 LysR substrate-binding domain-containing protein [Pyxidicoccus sp. MSG2]